MSEEVIIKKEALTMERIALMAMVGLLSWNVYTTSNLVTDVAVTNTKVEALTMQLTLNQQDRYTRSEALADSSVLTQRITNLEVWNGRLSDRLKAAEDALAKLVGSRQTQDR